MELEYFKKNLIDGILTIALCEKHIVFRNKTAHVIYNTFSVRKLLHSGRSTCSAINLTQTHPDVIFNDSSTFRPIHVGHASGYEHYKYLHDS